MRKLLDITELSEIINIGNLISFERSSMNDNNTTQFPMRTLSHTTETASLVILQEQLPRLWMVRIDKTDYSIDGEIEVVSESGSVEGNIIKFQIKGHEKLSFKAQNILQQIRVTTINYWLEIPLPVILFVVDVIHRVIYWIDVKSYIRDILSVAKPDWRRQKTIQIEIPIQNRLPESLDGIEQIALSHKEQIKAYQVALQESDVADFVGYHILFYCMMGT